VLNGTETGALQWAPPFLVAVGPTITSCCGAHCSWLPWDPLELVAVGPTTPGCRGEHVLNAVSPNPPSKY